MFRNLIPPSPKFPGLFVCALLTGCVTQEGGVAPPNVQMPEAYKYAVSESISAQPVTMAPSWWKRFGNPELDQLVERALASNLELKSAILRVEQANALVDVASADQLPEVNGTLGTEIEAPDSGIGTLRPGQRPTAEKLFQVGVEASYELDLWGKNKSRSGAAFERARASHFARETVTLTLIADVAQNYLEYVVLTERIENAESNVDALSSMLEVIKRRIEGGISSRVELNQQMTALADAKAEATEFRLERDRRVNALAVLTGTHPSDINIKGSGLNSLKIPNLAAGVPSRLLLQRPDIRESEANLRAAYADIDVARAELLPSVDLSAEVGYGAKHLQYLLSPQSLLYGVGATLTQSIFDAGRRKAQIKLEESEYRDLVYQYTLSVYQAIGEVENALAASAHLDEKIELLSDASKNAEAAFEVSKRSYGVGATDYLTLLETERTLFNQRDELLRAQFDRYRASIDLFRAVGGDAVPSVETSALRR